MALPAVTTTFAGDGNRGLQVGYNSGSIHLAPERPETPPRPSCFVPFRRDPDFVDRGTLLGQIGQRCAAPASRVALVGLGGVGKSQLAIEHCYRTAELSPQTWVFWVHAGNTARLQQSFRDMAEQVKVRGRKDPQTDVFKLVHDWLRDERNGPWLLVLDNADDAAVLRSSRARDGSNDSPYALKHHLSSYLPPSRHGAVIVTSRTKRAATQIVEDSDVISLEPMDGAAAYMLLRKKLGDRIDNDDGIAELAATLDCMPLALVQAAAYIRERAPRCSVQQYLNEYQQSDNRKTSLLNQAAGHLRRDETASNSVLITWQISFDHVRSMRQSATDLLSLMSFFDRQGIPEDVLHSPHGKANNPFEDDVVTLRDYSFITVTREEQTFEMHGLVQLATRTWLENQGQLDRWRTQFISNLCVKMPTGEHENWKKCQALFPHARAALAQRPDNKETLKVWALLLYNTAWYAWEQGRAAEAEEMAVVSMEVRTEALGEEHAETLGSMAMVGLARSLGGRYAEAETINRKTLARREKVLGPEHPNTLTSMINLAGVLNSQGKYKEAEAMNRQTLVWTEKVLGPEHLSTLTTMNNLALVLDRQGKYEEAEAINRQTLAQREKVLGPEHPDTLASMSNLALALTTQGKYKEAEAMNRQTLARKEKVLGREHPDTLISVFNLAYLLAGQHHYEESLALYKRAYTAYQTVLGTDHPITLACRQHYDEAQLQSEQALSNSSAQGLNSTTRVVTGKASRFARTLAKIGIRSAKESST
ncbi:TPR-like protein [Pyrenochaeta sp. DS3sAY3a]|nr:TPR-like protein [Pyrenochaeta sp. DS3sAY3a]